MNRLPKQWKHWCRTVGLRPVVNRRHFDDWLYLIGRGRVWRVTCNDTLQCGDRIEGFDRWAMCSLITSARVPRSLAEFEETVRHLIVLQEAA